MKYILTGNPNTGKTTIYNLLTKSNARVGNWHGVTINAVSKKVDNLEIVDLPGLYSLNINGSLEELNAIKYLRENSSEIILNIVDANNIARNLYLTKQLIDAGKKVCLIVNMIDDLDRNKKTLDINKLSQMLKIPVIATSGKDKKKLINDINNATFSFDKPTQTTTSEEIYDFIDNTLEKCLTNTNKNYIYGNTPMDKILLNKYLSIPIFMILIFGIFYLTFSSLGSFLSNGIRDFFLNNVVTSSFLQVYLKNNAYILYSFITECLLNGVVNVLCFMPQIVLLHLCLNILEETGYISRLAFVFEDFLGYFGLSGKSVFTLLMGVGCSATAITTAQNMTNDKSKIKLCMLTPNISCSAKLPIYTVIGGCFFGAKNIFIIAGLYLLGVLVLCIQGVIYNKTYPTKENFILEFPKYRLPNIKRVFKNAIRNCVNFIIKVGSVILIYSSLLWALQHFNFRLQFLKSDYSSSILTNISKVIAPLFAPIGLNSFGVVCALISGLIAKEMVISSIGILNGVGLSQVGISLTNSLSVVHFNTKTALVFLIFCLLYTPCMATFAMQKSLCCRKCATRSMVKQFVYAYVICLIAYFAMTICEYVWGAIILPLVILAIICIFIFKHNKKKHLNLVVNKKYI